MMRYRLRALASHALCVLLAAGLLAVGSGCTSSADEEGPTGPDAPVQTLDYESLAQSAVELETIDRGTRAQFAEGTQRVIRDRETFETFWRRLHANADAASSMPAVDFSSEMVLAVVLGERPTGGYRVDIASVTRNVNPTVVRAFVTEVQPGADCVVTQATTVPYHIVKLDALPSEQINFLDNGTQTTTCN